MLSPHQHEKLQALVQSAFTFDQPIGEHDSPRRTISINTRMMWKILLYDFAGKDTPLPQFGLFDDSFFPEEDDTDEGEETVEMEMFHNPTVDVDMSNGQALPPLSGQPRKRHVQDSRGRARRDQLLPSSIAAATPVLDAPFPEAAAAPWQMPGNTSVMDMTYDPFFQFQDPGSPFFGTWEVGNL